MTIKFILPSVRVYVQQFLMTSFSLTTLERLKFEKFQERELIIVTRVNCNGII